MMVPSYRMVIRTIAITGRQIPWNFVVIVLHQASVQKAFTTHDGPWVNAHWRHKEEDQKLQRARNAVDNVVFHPLENLPRQVNDFHDNSPGLWERLQQRIAMHRSHPPQRYRRSPFWAQAHRWRTPARQSQPSTSSRNRSPRVSASFAGMSLVVRICVPTPITRHVSFATAMWSPVINFTWIPSSPSSDEDIFRVRWSGSENVRFPRKPIFHLRRMMRCRDTESPSQHTTTLAHQHPRHDERHQDQGHSEEKRGQSSWWLLRSDPRHWCFATVEMILSRSVCFPVTRRTASTSPLFTQQPMGAL